MWNYSLHFSLIFPRSQFEIHFNIKPFISFNPLLNSKLPLPSELPLLCPLHVHWVQPFLNNQMLLLPANISWHLKAPVQSAMCFQASLHRHMDVIVALGDAYYLPARASRRANWGAATLERSGPKSEGCHGFCLLHSASYYCLSYM